MCLTTFVLIYISSYHLCGKYGGIFTILDIFTKKIVKSFLVKADSLDIERHIMKQNEAQQYCEELLFS